MIGLAAAFYRPLDEIEDTNDDSDSNVHIDKSVLFGAGAAAAAGVCFAVVWFFMIKACAKQLIWAGLIFSVVHATCRFKYCSLALIQNLCAVDDGCCSNVGDLRR